MKRFESLADPELNKKFIKQYILVHKTGNEYNVDKSIESQYDYIGETENTLNEYVSTFFSTDEYNLDNDNHLNVNDIDNQLKEIENVVSQYQLKEITDFNESVNDLNNFGIYLKNPNKKGYYSESLIKDIERDLLDESIVNIINEKKNEILNND